MTISRIRQLIDDFRGSSDEFKGWKLVNIFQYLEKNYPGEVQIFWGGFTKKDLETVIFQ